MLTTPFVYTGGHIEILIEYTQQGGQTADIPWRYDNVEFLLMTIQLSTSLDAPLSRRQHNLTNLRKPQIIFNFPTQNNVGVDRILLRSISIERYDCPVFYVKNTGLTTQTFTTTLQGPNGYASTKSSTSIAPDSVHQIEFDPSSQR